MQINEGGKIGILVQDIDTSNISAVIVFNSENLLHMWPKFRVMQVM